MAVSTGPSNRFLPLSPCVDFMSVRSIQHYIRTTSIPYLRCPCSEGSQLPLLFVGGTLPFIAADTGGASVQAWVPVSYSLALASVAPFCGSLQDILGRRNIALGGSVSICVGIIIVGTAHTLPQVIVGMVFAGAGAAVGELTALAG